MYGCGCCRCCSYLLVWSGRASCALQTALSCSTPGTWHHCPRVLCHHGQCSTEALSRTDAYLFDAEHLVIWISKIHVKMFDSCTELPIHEYFLTDWNTKPLLGPSLPLSASVWPCHITTVLWPDSHNTGRWHPRYVRQLVVTAISILLPGALNNCLLTG